MKALATATLSIGLWFCTPSVSETLEALSVPPELIGRYADSIAEPHCPYAVMHVTEDGFVFLSETEADAKETVCPATVTERDEGWIEGEYLCPDNEKRNNEWSVNRENGYLFVVRGPYYSESQETYFEVMDVYEKCED